MSKLLIINADDFGYNIEQNKAIKELYEKKLISSFSLMAVGPESADAVEFCRKNDVPTGVHLTINSDEKNSLWKSISDTKSFENGLPYEQKELIFGVRREDVRTELEAQYQFIVKKGARADYADNHCGTLYGINGRRFYKDAFDFCKNHNLPYRFPKTPGFLERQLGRAVPKPIIKFQEMIVRCGEKRGVKMLDDLVSNPWSVERIGDYNTLEKYYLDAVDNCIDGITEMFLHPALPLDGEQGEWQKRVYEYRILKSGCLPERAKQRGVEIVSRSCFNNLF